MEKIKTRMTHYLSLNGYEKQRYEFTASFFNNVNGNFLDVGCHTGTLSNYLGDNIEYHGVDAIDVDFKNYRRIDLNENKLPYPDNYFDAVNCSAVLEHVFYPYELLCEAKRVLKDTGTLLVALPNDKGLSVLFAYFFQPIESYDDSIAQHHWKFSINTARKFFEKEFKIIKESPEFGPLFRKYLPFLKFKPFCTEWFMLGTKK